MALLTILTFIFIPINAVCGFFGMNIIEVQVSGGFHFWVLGATMGTVLGLTLILAFVESISAISSLFIDELGLKGLLGYLVSLGSPNFFFFKLQLV